MPDRHGPFRNSRFLLEIDGITKAGFSKCTLPRSETKHITYREGNDRPTPRKLWSLTHYGDLILESGVTEESQELFEWRKLVEQGRLNDARRSIAVVVLNEEGEPGIRWEFRHAWPRAYSLSALDAQADAVAIERLDIAVEGMQRIK